MKTADLDTMTSKVIRLQLENRMERNLETFKSFIDKEILIILGQMDPASRIEDYLYLGSEWNASNLEELGQNGISHILNVTREIDNFFPGNFRYLNVRVYDEETTDLVRQVWIRLPELAESFLSLRDLNPKPMHFSLQSSTVSSLWFMSPSKKFSIFL